MHNHYRYCLLKAALQGIDLRLDSLTWPAGARAQDTPKSLSSGFSSCSTISFHRSSEPGAQGQARQHGEFNWVGRSRSTFRNHHCPFLFGRLGSYSVQLHRGSRICLQVLFLRARGTEHGGETQSAGPGVSVACPPTD